MGAGHEHAHGRDARGLGIAFLLNFGFTLVEAIGGLLTNSVAILSDAVHDAGDSLSLGVSWLLQRKASQQSDTNYTYGYRRFSVLGALITGVLLLVGIGFIITRALQRFTSPEPVHAGGMIGIAVLGIAVNGIAAWRLRSGKSLNERVASWHLLEDVLGWVAVLLGGLALMFWDLPYLDPALSILISLFVLWNVLKHLRKVFTVFLQRAPHHFDVAEFVSSVRNLPGVTDVHHTHTWTIDGEHHVLTTHVVMEPQATREQIVEAKERVRSMLPEESFEHVTIDVEINGERCVSCPA
jgi:cobalt-zinc-cadmium efflux system protein